MNDTNTAVSVDYATADGTATNGLKYMAVAGTLAFGVGETNQTIVVPILNNGLVDGTKNFRVILSNPTDAVLGTRTNATVSITDNDVGMQFEFATYSVAEDAGAVLIGVVRGDDGILPVTVDLATTDLTATSGLDYTGITNTLAFAPQRAAQAGPHPDPQRRPQGGERDFSRHLEQSDGRHAWAVTKTTTVTIMDNDQGFQFESAGYTVAEDAGAVLICVPGAATTRTRSPGGGLCHQRPDRDQRCGLHRHHQHALVCARGKGQADLRPDPQRRDQGGQQEFSRDLSNPSGGVLGSADDHHRHDSGQ